MDKGKKWLGSLCTLLLFSPLIMLQMRQRACLDKKNCLNSSLISNIKLFLFVFNQLNEEHLRKFSTLFNSFFFVKKHFFPPLSGRAGTALSLNVISITWNNSIFSRPASSSSSLWHLKIVVKVMKIACRSTVVHNRMHVAGFVKHTHLTTNS